MSEKLDKLTLMPQIESYCSSCHQQIKMEVGQAAIALHLRWYVAYTCSYCQTAVEMDDTGFPPDEVRNIILSGEGKWELVIKRSHLKKVVAIKILRQALNLSLAEAGRLLENFPNSLISGTKTEMEWLKQLLATEKIEALVVRQNENDILPS